MSAASTCSSPSKSASSDLSCAFFWASAVAACTLPMDGCVALPLVEYESNATRGRVQKTMRQFGRGNGDVGKLLHGRVGNDAAIGQEHHAVFADRGRPPVPTAPQPGAPSSSRGPVRPGPVTPGGSRRTVVPGTGIRRGRPSVVATAPQPGALRSSRVPMRTGAACRRLPVGTAVDCRRPRAATGPPEVSPCPRPPTRGRLSTYRPSWGTRPPRPRSICRPSSRPPTRARPSTYPGDPGGPAARDARGGGPRGDAVPRDRAPHRGGSRTAAARRAPGRRGDAVHTAGTRRGQASARRFRQPLPQRPGRREPGRGHPADAPRRAAPAAAPGLVRRPPAFPRPARRRRPVARRRYRLARARHRRRRHRHRRPRRRRGRAARRRRRRR